MTAGFRLPSLLALVTLLSACALYWDQFGPEVHLYEGPKRDASEVAVIDQGAGCYTCVASIKRLDQKDPLYAASDPGWEPAGSGLNRPNKIFVLPGKYLVTLHFTDAPETIGTVDLQPGHTYLVQNDVFTDGQKASVWMEDGDSGTIILGEKR